MKITQILEMNEAPVHVKKQRTRRDVWKEMYAQNVDKWMQLAIAGKISSNWYGPDGPKTPYLDVRQYGRRFDMGGRGGIRSGNVAILNDVSPGQYRIRDVVPNKNGTYDIVIMIPERGEEGKRTITYDPNVPKDTMTVRIGRMPGGAKSALGLLRWRKAIGWDK